MSNVFRFTSVTYAQFPEDLVDDKLAKLKFHSVKLYLLILRRAQQKSSPIIKIRTDEAAQILRLNKNSHGPAREELKRHGLVKSTEVNNQGLWSYQLLNPLTGRPIANPHTAVDFNKFDGEQVKYYFLHHLADFDAIEDDNGLRSRCPFHVSLKQRTKPLSMKLTDGGVWNCFTCGKSGKLIDFETELALKRKKPISSSEAHQRIRRIVSQAELPEPEFEDEPVQAI